MRRSKSQNISALALSLNRYHKSATPPFYSDIQSDTRFLIIRCKDNAKLPQVENNHKENARLNPIRALGLIVFCFLAEQMVQVYAVYHDCGTVI